MTLLDRLDDFYVYRVLRLPRSPLSFSKPDESGLARWEPPQSGAWDHWHEVMRRTTCEQSDEYRAAWQAALDEGRRPWHESLRWRLRFPVPRLYRYHPRRLRHYRERLHYGAGYEDAWCGHVHLAWVTARIGREILENGYTYPGNGQWPTFERWQEDVRALTEGMEHIAWGCDVVEGIADPGQDRV